MSTCRSGFFGRTRHVFRTISSPALAASRAIRALQSGCSLIERLARSVASASASCSFTATIALPARSTSIADSSSFSFTVGSTLT
jgi:hypothetical protein